MTKDDFDARQAKRLETVTESRHKIVKWLKGNQNNSRPKFLKAYVIDKDGHFFNNQPLTDNYPFVFRNQLFIANAKKEITNIKPQLIIYNLENIDKETLEANADIAHTYNDSRMLQHLIKTVKEVCAKQPPIIIVFNSGEYDSAYMQKVFNYTSILAVNEEMTVELSLKMADMLKSKIMPSLPQPKPGDVYIDKSTDLSYSEIESDITLVACSENDVYFNTPEVLDIGTVLRITLPVSMYITVVPVPEYSSIASQFYGIIHGIGEESRQELRRFINSIFFRNLETQKASDKEDVAKLKQTYIDKQEEKINAEKKLAEAKDVEKQVQLEREKDQATTDKAQDIVDALGGDNE